MKKHTEETRRELCIMHPCGLLVYRDGSVLLPRGRSYGAISSGYKQVSYQGKNYRVHRLVAEAFIPNPDNKPTVDHINQRRDDNRVENLRWASYKEQMNYKDQNLNVRKITNKNKRVLQCDLDGNVMNVYNKTSDVKVGGFSDYLVWKCCHNEYMREGNNVYKGYIWRYEEDIQNC